MTKVNANEFFGTFLASAKHIPNWLISYRDHAYPNESEMKAIIASQGRESNMKSQQHHYSITSRHGENSNAMERLFICRKAKAMKQAADLRTQMDDGLKRAELAQRFGFVRSPQRVQQEKGLVPPAPSPA